MEAVTQQCIVPTLCALCTLDGKACFKHYQKQPASWLRTQVSQACPPSTLPCSFLQLRRRSLLTTLRRPTLPWIQSFSTFSRIILSFFFIFKLPFHLLVALLIFVIFKKQFGMSQRLIYKFSGQPQWRSSLVPPAAQGVVLETQDQVPSRALCMEPASPSACVSAPPPPCVSL